MRHVLAAAGLAVTVVAGSAAPAFAGDHDSHHGRPKPWPACPGGEPRSAYPPRACSAETDRTAVRPGGEFNVYGAGFRPGESVTIAMADTATDPLATVAANADGAVVTSVAVPDDASVGAHPLVLTAASGNEVAGRIAVLAPPAGTAAEVAHRDLPFSGAAAVIPLSAAGSLMVAAGAVVLMMVRRRRRLGL